MFVDVDLPPPPSRSFFSRLFGKKKTPPDPDPSNAALNRLANAITTQPELKVRVYRTAAGLRYIFVHRPYDSTAPETTALLKALGADEKFILLCRIQKCFRARLTPKPWRCGHHADHPKFDGNTERPDPLYQKWLQDYKRASSSYAACKFINEYGNGSSDPALQKLVAFHDHETRCTSGLPLA